MQTPASPVHFWKRPLVRRGATACVTGIILVCLYRSADWHAVLSAVWSLQPGYLAAALLLFVPQTVISAWRWQQLVAPKCRITLWLAVRQTLAASALNLALPSKLGDLSKAAMLPGQSSGDRLGLAGRVTAEKLSDVAALAGLLAIGWLGAGTVEVFCLLAAVWTIHIAWLGGLSRAAEKDIRASDSMSAWWALVPGSITLWVLHLAQLHLFLWAAGVETTVTETLARVPLAIFAGLIPVAMMGIGTRDAALIWLFSDLAPAATLAAVGLLTALRYIIPGAVGIPLLSGVWQPRPERANATNPHTRTVHSTVG